MHFVEVKLEPATSCALCHRRQKLRDSHIIPEFLYTSLYDDKHRFHEMSVIPEQNNSLHQKGVREPLLCAECEGLFSEWERYASLVLKGGVELSYRREGSLIYIGGLDYAKFRLFQLSVLWRAGVSSLPFFDAVGLGKHAEILRQLLLRGDPGRPFRYGCLMFGIKVEDEARVYKYLCNWLSISIKNQRNHRWPLLRSNKTPYLMNC